MTPLAHKVAKELTLPKRLRTFKDKDAGVLTRMDDIHCFDVTNVYPLAYQIARDVSKICDGPLTSFLPAPRMWIESYREADKSRYAWRIEEVPHVENEDKTMIEISEIMDCPGQEYFGVMAGPEFMSLRHGPLVLDKGVYSGWYRDGFSPENLIPAFLLLINSPKVIGRRQHMPHRGLQKRLTAAMKPAGKFPLHAWTEIKLEVTTPRDASGEPVAEGHLTGQRALHFCRSHVRVRLGRLEIVRSHWRGDPALGLKQARYKVTA